VERIAYLHRPKEPATGPVTLTRDDFTQAELKTLDEFLESRAGKRLDLPFTSMTVSPCGECNSANGPHRGLRMSISGMRFCIPCEDGK
jgi:hypothetical protein